jgi:6-phosphofructokinase
MSGMNAFYAQSGGVTAVINATAAGVIETARKHTNKITKVYAGRNGIIIYARRRLRFCPLQAQGHRGKQGRI